MRWWSCEDVLLQGPWECTRAEELEGIWALNASQKSVLELGKDLLGLTCAVGGVC